MSEALAAWKGYAFDRPGSKRWESVYPGAELDLRELLWARLLSQLAKRPSLPGLSYECDRSALGDARTCGRGAGLVRACEEGGHRYFTPLGCGTPWCLRCTGMAADLRAMKVHRDLRELSSLAFDLEGVRPPVLRLQLTLCDEEKSQVIEAGRDGVNSLILAGRRAIVAAAGSTGSMPLMITLHPTSSSRPWIRSPHLHAVALWCDMDAEGVRPLAWAAPGRPIDADALRIHWAKEYPGSKVVRAAYYTHGPDASNGAAIAQGGGGYTRPSRGGRQTLASALRYDLRPFQEDAFAAISARRLGVPGGGMAELLNGWRPPTLRCEGAVPDAEVPDRLQAQGGVLMWPRFHRVRRYGALASRGFVARTEALHLLAGRERGERSPLCDCPECGSMLSVEMNEDEDTGARWPRMVGRGEAECEGLGLLPGPGLGRKSREVLP
jgi:hypothetical protein